MTAAAPSPQAGRARWPGSTVLAGAVVLLLAASALWWPPRGSAPVEGLFLVVDPLAQVRGDQMYVPLGAWLAAGVGRPLRLLVVHRVADVPARAWQDVGLVLCPDGVALGLPQEDFTTVAAARRQAPQNLRPRSVLVYRLAAGFAPAPWITAPARTVLGDSLSLAGCGAACRTGGYPWRERSPGRPVPKVGADPYDHGPVLQALALGCFDYALVREWTARRWTDAGLLDPATWGMTPVTAPLPDVVVLVSRRWSAADRVRVGERLVSIGRRQEAGTSAREVSALSVLERLGLAGFNPLLEPDFELTRRQFAPDRPADRP
ncbi:MAG: hypothetical protein ACYDIE_07220 [Candidatus Krumholzibacteriia bacterium]